MKIVHVVEPLAAGIVTFIKSLVENLPQDQHIIIHGERKLVERFSEVKKQFIYPNVEFLRWKSAQRSLRLKKDFNAAVELYKILKRFKESHSLDIVHLHCSKSGFIGRFVCRLLGIQHLVVYTPNGASFLSGTSRSANYLYTMLEKIAFNFGGQVVCCSPSERKAFESIGVNAITINNGTRHNTTLPVGSVQTKKEAVFRVVTSGRIVHQKDPALFNEIAAYFEDLELFEFLWIGDGTERDMLTSKNITVTGWLSQDAAAAMVTSADLYLSTAVFEGLPFAVLEALALKKPVLLTDCVGNKDLVLKGLNGSVFQYKFEAIIKILEFYNNASMMSVMGEYSGDHCKMSFDREDTYHGYKKLYRQAARLNKKIGVNLNQLAYASE